LAYCRFRIGETPEDALQIFNYFRLPEDFQLTPESVKIHGITSEQLQEQGRRWEDIIHRDSRFIQDLNECDYIIAHNVQFDMNILLNELHRIKHPISLKWTNKVRCTCKLTDYTRLKDLYELCYSGYSGQKNIRYHDASGDVLALYRILDAMSKDYDEE
jgi:DNA polymerase III epsilon subunit-like protein